MLIDDDDDDNDDDDDDDVLYEPATDVSLFHYLCREITPDVSLYRHRCLPLSVHLTKKKTVTRTILGRMEKKQFFFLC